MRSTGRRAGLRYVRKRLDIGVGDVVRALLSCLSAPISGSGPRAASRLCDQWPEPQTVVPVLSARSGFDALLAAVDWPPGSEVIVSGVTIPHLPRLVREHGYVPVGVDVDPATMAVDVADVAARCTSRTRAVLLAHLFGGRLDIAPLARLTRSRGLLLVDDRAQRFTGRTEALGDADVALYSFGTIKTATAFGGGVLLVADAQLRRRMTAVMAHWPEQTTAGYTAKLLKGAALVGLSTPAGYHAFTGLLARLGVDDDALVRRLTRG